MTYIAECQNCYKGNDSKYGTRRGEFYERFLEETVNEYDSYNFCLDCDSAIRFENARIVRILKANFIDNELLQLAIELIQGKDNVN